VYQEEETNEINCRETGVANGTKRIFKLIKAMLGEASSRPTISDVLGHFYFNPSSEQGVTHKISFKAMFSIYYPLFFYI